jgi:hypothetical protein
MTALEKLIEAKVAEALAEIERARYRGSPPDLRVCRHEAAHAVVCWLVGGSPLVEVVVRDDASGEMTNEATQRAAEAPPGEDHAGRLVALRADHPAILSATCAKHIATVLAGVTADHRAGYGDWRASFADLRQADRLAEIAVGRQERDRFLVPIRAGVKLAVHDAWPLIVELADLLSDERRLPGPFVEAWLETRPAALSLRLYYSAAFASPVGSAA